MKLLILLTALVALSYFSLGVRADHLEGGYHCNCVGCQNPQLIHGSVDWCRCCENSMIELCRSDTTEDYRCQRSVFDPVGCIRDGYMTLYCLPEEEPFGNSTFNGDNQVNDPDLSHGTHPCDGDNNNDSEPDKTTVIVLAVFLGISLLLVGLLAALVIILYRKK